MSAVTSRLDRLKPRAYRLSVLGDGDTSAVASPLPGDKAAVAWPLLDGGSPLLSTAGGADAGPTDSSRRSRRGNRSEPRTPDASELSDAIVADHGGGVALRPRGCAWTLPVWASL